MTRIFLIGYMGAGKTTLGKAFAREMSLNFIDLGDGGCFHGCLNSFF